MCCCCCRKEKERVPEAASTLCYVVVSIKLGSNGAEQCVGGARSVVLFCFFYRSSRDLRVSSNSSLMPLYFVVKSSTLRS